MNLKKIHFLFLSILIGFAACQKNEPSVEYNYGTKSDSALYYFNKGWVSIMDEGRWMDSEKFYRKAVEFDPNFIIGKSLVGRITQNLHERIAIQKELEDKIVTLDEDSKLLLQVYLASIRSMNKSGQGLGSNPSDSKNRIDLSEKNFRSFLKKHPNEDYIKAEYIEVLHRKYGAKTALDSMYLLATERQLKLPFYIHYNATIEAELGNFERALQLSDDLKNSLNNPMMPNQYLILADIYYRMDSLKQARFMIEKVVSLDPKHIIGQGLRKSIYAKLAKDKK
tara:strand:- start:16015 stop:16857 length:843 start_codon:yes stop_codon:yes gene_type:complete